MMHPAFRALALGLLLGAPFAVTATAGAEQPSCSLAVTHADDTTMTVRYVSGDGVARTVWANGHPTTLADGATATIARVDNVEYPQRGTWWPTDWLMKCGGTTTTTTSSTSTTVQPTTTTAQARPAIVCPTGSALRLSTTDGRNRDGVYDMPALIGGVRRETNAGEPVWVSVWTFDRPTQVETWGAVTADCIPMVPPTITTQHTTPQPSTSLPPATSTSVELLPPVTVPGVPTTVGLPRLPETGGGQRALIIGGAVTGLGAVGALAERQLRKDRQP